MEQLYLVGEPIFTIEDEIRDKFNAPAGQVALCQDIIRETQDKEMVRKKLQEEYLAIIYALKEMRINIRIIYSHPESIDEKTLATCIGSLGCRLIGFDKNFYPPSVAYPRDFATVLPGLILVNPEIAKLMIKEKDGYRISSSLLGVGGRILHSDGNALVAERLIRSEGRSVSAANSVDRQLSRLKIAYYPSPVACAYNTDVVDEQPHFNDHIDRVGCLLRGRDGRLHHIGDPHCCVIKWRGRDKIPLWYVLPELESIVTIRSRLRKLGIVDHGPNELTIPYAMNLVQFPDDRVLMTSGDPGMQNLVEDIVGADKVVTTPVPIRYFPVWKYAGIRCLVNEAPMPLLKTITPT
ncbi:MAG: hypothetical protein V1838_05170 [Patescibacteria group bacterium]